MTNEKKDKIIDRVIDFLHNKPLKSDIRIASALIEELKLVKNYSIPERLGNHANRLLCAGLCLNCKHQSYKSDKTFTKTGICLVKFWKDKRCKLSPNKPVLKCADFEPCT